MLIPRAQQIKGKGARRLPTMKPARRTHKLNLTKHDIRGPLRVAGAQASAANTQAQVAEGTARVLEQGFKDIEAIVEQWTIADAALSAAEVAADYQKRLGDLTSELTNSPSIPADHPYVTEAMRHDSRTLTIAPDGTETYAAAKTVASHKYMTDIYDTRSGQLEQEALAQLKTPEAREAFFKAIRTPRATSSANIIKQQNVWRRGELKAKGDNAYARSLELADPVAAEAAARSAAKTAYDTGAWTAEEYFGKLATLGTEIDMRGYLRQIVETDDPAMLNDIQTDILEGDNRLGFAEEVKLSKQILTKIAKIEKETEDNLDDELKDRSTRRMNALVTRMDRGGPLSYDEIDGDEDLSDDDKLAIKALNRARAKDERAMSKANAGRSSGEQLNNLLIDLHKNGALVDWEVVKLKTRGLSDTDARIFINANNAMKTGPKEDDGQAVAVGMSLVANMRMGTTNVTARRVNAFTELNALMGMDASGKPVGKARLTYQTYLRLAGEIENAGGSVYETKQVKFALDYGYAILTGGSRDSLGLVATGVNVQNAAEFQNDLLAAAEKEGISFDAKAWWVENRDEYLTVAMLENQEDLDDERVTQHIIYYDFKADDKTVKRVNLDATLKSVREKSARRGKGGAGLSTDVRDMVIDFATKQARFERERYDR